MENKFLDVKEVAKYLNGSEGWIRSLIREKEIPFIKIKGRIMFIKKDVEQWIESHKKREKE